MKVEVLRLSDIVRENRFDAGYHLLSQKHADDVVRLRAAMDEDTARTVVLGLPDSVLTKRVDGEPLLAPLGRGSFPRTGLKDMYRIAAEYPHLALAVLTPHLADAISDARTEIDDIERSIAVLEDVKRLGAGEKPQ